jgi:dimethylsulfoniopropionate demethylase
LSDKILSISRRTRATPFTNRVESSDVKAYTVYNHMLLPTVFESLEADYWHLCEHVQVWDVAAERQVELIGPDAQKLVQLMTPRDVRKAVDNQCFYVPLCDENGMILNDPIATRHSADHWWVSISDSDILLWAKGLATGFGLDVKVTEPDVSPLALQGPKAEDLAARVFGESVRDIRFFRGKMMKWRDTEFFVARSGWSKQGGFEIYLNDSSLGEALWDDCFDKGKDLNVRAGCPNLIERVESGLMSFGNDIHFNSNPFECGLDRFLEIEPDSKTDIESLSLNALRQLKGQSRRSLVGLVFDKEIDVNDKSIHLDNTFIGEIRSCCWSPRYKKFLAFAMMQTDFLDHHSEFTFNGSIAKVHSIPFDIETLKS